MASTEWNVWAICRLNPVRTWRHQIPLRYADVGWPRLYTAELGQLTGSREVREVTESEMLGEVDVAVWDCWYLKRAAVVSVVSVARAVRGHWSVVSGQACNCIWTSQLVKDSHVTGVKTVTNVGPLPVRDSCKNPLTDSHFALYCFMSSGQILSNQRQHFTASKWPHHKLPHRLHPVPPRSWAAHSFNLLIKQIRILLQNGCNMELGMKRNNHKVYVSVRLYTALTFESLDERCSRLASSCGSFLAG